MPCISLTRWMLDGLRRSVQDKKIIGTISEMAIHCARPVTLETWDHGAITLRPVPTPTMFRTVSDTSYRGMWWFAEWKDLTPTTRLPPLQFSVVHSQFSLRDKYDSCYEFIRFNDGRGPVLYGYATMSWGTPFSGGFLLNGGKQLPWRYALPRTLSASLWARRQQIPPAWLCGPAMSCMMRWRTFARMYQHFMCKYRK